MSSPQRTKLPYWGLLHLISTIRLATLVRKKQGSLHRVARNRISPFSVDEESGIECNGAFVGGSVELDGTLRGHCGDEEP
jgi:hypothetical protein